MTFTKSNNRYIPILLLICLDFFAGLFFFWPFGGTFSWESPLGSAALITGGGGIATTLTLWLLGSYKTQNLLHGEIKIKEVTLVATLLFIADCYLFAVNREFLKELSQWAPLSIATFHLITFLLLLIGRPAVTMLVSSLKRKNIICVNSITIAFQQPSETVFIRIKRYILDEHNKLNGYFATEPLFSTDKGPIQYLGNLSTVIRFLKDRKVDEVVILGNPSSTQATSGLLIALRMTGAEIKMVPVEFDFLSGLMKMSSLKDVPHVKLSAHTISPANRFAKSTLDITISLIGITITIALFPWIFLIIKATSKGPIIYRQQRLGKNARPFTLIKFRTMYPEAELNGPQLSSNLDRRITPGGKALRYWHLDELPQFWNILKGDMSLVGPRPERPFYARMLRDKIPYYKAIYQVKPGLTSLGMVKYGYASSLEEMTDRLYYDIAYINNPSVITDLKVIAHTLWYIFQKAYKDPKESRLEKERAAGIHHEHNEDVIQRWIELKK
jgi:exopolysaccharide biosynthesis polyprenyl glycosylphosphotransferase